MILADDLGYGDVGCFNADSKIPTPNLDRLAGDAPTAAAHHLVQLRRDEQDAHALLAQAVDEVIVVLERPNLKIKADLF